MENDKLMGSAQRRVKNAVLQHGSLILGRHFKQQPSAELFADCGSDSQVLGELTGKLADQLAHTMNARCERTGYTDIEKSIQVKLNRKYLSESWNCER